ncbi:acyl carrier protein [Polaromonas sp. CG_23.6]|uniref:acyl carrier protein n=1 Tax=Polaromonas sp. CG_23.6 TaxID=2760709 RepID=UPI002473FBC0|nr:acyl carrier protein [Polaromonas sp. CG_23.6]MDH6185333.1 acyl carrier protein [Polaromonas sp. CG_23.6]
MPSTTTFDRLFAILMKDYKLDAAQLTPDAPLEDLGIDSLGVADLLFNIEDEFGITLPPEPVQLLTVGDVARFIDGLLAKQQNQAGAPSAASSGILPGAISSTVP